MGHEPFKEPFNLWYFLGIVLALLVPTLPATIGWFKVFF